MDETGDEGDHDTAARLGLCAACRHARAVSNDRGRVFVFCKASAQHPQLPKYPYLPVLACPAYTSSGEGGQAH